MRKALIAVIAAAVLFAVGAFAANLTVSSEDIASGSNSVLPCSTDVEIDFQPGTFDETVNDWDVTAVVVDFNTTACNGGTATLVVEGASNAILYGPVNGDAAITGGSVTFTITAGDLLVNPIQDASILVDGVTLP